MLLTTPCIYGIQKPIFKEIKRIEIELTCLVCPIIKDRFSIILKAPAVRILYISFPKPASEALPKTKPCLQNCSGGRFRTLEAPKMKFLSKLIDLKKTSFPPENKYDKRFRSEGKSKMVCHTYCP